MAPRLEPIETNDLMEEEATTTTTPIELTPKGGTPVGKLFQCCFPKTPSFSPSALYSKSKSNKSKKVTFVEQDEKESSSNHGNDINMDDLPDLGESDEESHLEETSKKEKKDTNRQAVQQTLLIGFFQILLSFLNNWRMSLAKRQPKCINSADHQKEQVQKVATEA